MKKCWIGTILVIILATIPFAAYPDEWTFMVYMDGDNNLEEYAIDDFLEMASVTDSTVVNIVVQFDRIPGYSTEYGDWKTCHRFKIAYNMDPTPANAIVDWGDGAGGREVNMGDPDTLKDFVNWATTNYPATRYALILWNHGSGWRDAMKAKGLDREAMKAVCWDDTSASDCLYMSEVRRALIDMTENSMDLIGFDACLMGMIEVAYHIYSYGSVMVASEESEPACGWPYDDILTALVATPSMTPSTLGTQIVNDYMAHTTTKDYTQSAIDLTKISALASAVDSFAQALGYNSDIVNASTYVEYYEDSAHIDLYDFARLCQFYSSDSTIDSRAQTVMDNVTSAVITNGHSSTYYPDSHGLAIYFPYTEATYDSNYESASVNPFSSTHWDEFLHNYYNQVAPPGGDGGTTTGTKGGGSSGGQVCFIATAAYSGKGIGEGENRRRRDSHRFTVSPFHRFATSSDDPVAILQRFRDEYLLTNEPGRAFVSCYERISPPIARYIKDKEPLKAVVRFYLKPIVWGAGKMTKPE